MPTAWSCFEWWPQATQAGLAPSLVIDSTILYRCTPSHGLTGVRSPLLSLSQLIFKYKVNELVHFTLLV